MKPYDTTTASASTGMIFPYPPPPYAACRRYPHCCPVCGGTGTKPANFYEPFCQGEGTTVNNYPVTCKACTGSGIVWEYVT